MRAHLLMSSQHGGRNGDGNVNPSPSSIELNRRQTSLQGWGGRAYSVLRNNSVADYATSQLDDIKFPSNRRNSGTAEA